MQNEQHAARENARTPMQWDKSKNAGFTTGKPWINLNPDYKNGVNVESQLEEEKTVLSYFKKIVALRKACPALVYGTYQIIKQDHEQVYAYTRQLDNQRFLILLNFSNETEPFSLPLKISYNRKVKMIYLNQLITYIKNG